MKRKHARHKAINVAPYPFDDNNLEQIKVSVQRGFQLFKGEGSEKLGITKEAWHGQDQL